MTNFALLQTNIAFCDPEANFKRVRELFAQAMAKDPRPDVVVLPEDWSAGFSDEMFHHMEDFVEPENGPSVTVLRELARQYQVWVVGGSIATLHADGKMRNTTFLIDRRGEIVGDYSKMHLYSDMDEHVPFANGDKTEVYDTELGRLGMMICYDIRFCELARTYALKKADVLVVTSDFPNPRVNHWRTLLTARAIENQMFVVATNSCGTAGQTKYAGHSILLDPWGEVLVLGGEGEQIMTADLDLEVVRGIRESINVYRDRRPALYEIK